MKRTLIQPDLSAIPARFHPFLQDASVFDSSCSRLAKVFYLEKGDGFFLKTAPAGTLAKEAAMTRFFHEKGLGAQVLDYVTLDADWMLTRKVPGEDCLHPMYLEDPQRLCDITAELLRQLHEIAPDHAPVNRTADILATARKNYQVSAYDLSLFPDNWGYATPEEAWEELCRNSRYLQSDTLLHGDYCLPNIILQDWQFSGFIDLDAAGAGDRHIDLFWGIWSLEFNLKTDQYRQRFLDAYGRDLVCEDALRTVAACEVFL